MASNYEKLIGAEWLAVMVIQTGDALGQDAATGKFALPDPSRYFASMVVFLMLAGASMFGDRVARLCAMFGGVAALAMVMLPPKPTLANPNPKPVVLGFINYLTQMINGGSAGGLGKAPAPTTSGSATTKPSGGLPNPLLWGNDILQEAGRLAHIPFP